MQAPTTQERRHDLIKRGDFELLHAAPPERLNDIDRKLHAAMAQLTSGLSPNSMALAWMDWTLHLSQSPGKWQQLMQQALGTQLRWSHYSLRATLGLPVQPCVVPLPQDRRFRSPSWQQWPYNLLQQGFLLNQQWWQSATTGIDGVSKHHEQLVAFAARQLLDLASPLNFVATNPDVAAATVAQGGANLARGAANLLDDQRRRGSGVPPAGAEAFAPGVAVAVTPGRVVFRNRLIELIQYAPATDTVHGAPVLIVPAWIMKYYILDLSPHNSLVRHLVAHGHTVFMISWRNPDADDSELGMEDYARLGVMEALAQVRARVPGQPVNAVGYCLGGTLLAIVAAALGCGAGGPLSTITLLAAQVDFSEAGELLLFIDESQIAWLEDLMWQQGFLDNRQMAGAFKLLRSNDLVWSLAVNQYLLGQRAPMTDLMAWNADSTRMPRRMHSDYLRKLFLNNDLFSGRYRVGQRPVSLTDIRLPLFAVATMSDHVSPWRSVHKVHLLSGCDIAFVLTSGGHNAGIVSEPGHKGRHYYAAQQGRGTCYTDPDRWLEGATECQGSWWDAWLPWLARHAGEPVPARLPEEGLCAAPGTYVLQR
jgi:polyhydroxyalkanoate synthase